MSANPFDADPETRMRALAELRAVCPVAPLGDRGPYIVLSHAALAEGFKRVEDFGGSAGQQGLAEDEKTIAGMLEPRHGQVRRIINAVVAFHKSQKIEPYLEELSEQLLDRIIAAAAEAGPEGIDVMPLFAEPIPPRAMAALLGFPSDDADLYYSWAEQLGLAFAAAVGEGRSISMTEACPEMFEYVLGHVERRRAIPTDEWPNDAVSRFLTTEIGGERLTPRAIAIQIMFMIGAGSETTRALLGNMLYRLALQPDVYERVRSAPRLVDPLVEEALRIDAPAQFMVRRCLHGGSLGGVELAEGTQVMLAIAAGNHDPDVFPDPERFDIERDTRDHLTFGQGAHICPGAALARLEARTAMQTFVRRVAAFRLGDSYEFDHAPTGMLHGPKTLRLVIEPGS